MKAAGKEIRNEIIIWHPVISNLTYPQLYLLHFHLRMLGDYNF